MLRFANKHLAKRAYSNKQLLGRYQEFPIDLTRIESLKKGIVLRDKAAQAKKKSFSYDLIVHPDGLVHPAPNTSEWIGPNGASMRPPDSTVLKEVIGSMKNSLLILVPAGTKIPEDLVLLHEHSDHYSLQTSVPITLAKLNARLNEFFKPFERLTNEQYAQRYH